MKNGKEASLLKRVKRGRKKEKNLLENDLRLN